MTTTDDQQDATAGLGGLSVEVLLPSRTADGPDGHDDGQEG